ncbi:hypothetical protein [Alicyclobacillus sp. SO9]|uniref:hypothetical protein n=1 Tax=Alicyclobacillus sp. SO9 TaxID=2665646 RepID=UPI0018E723B9|nr:hypothetical protein [Alicyclobacillus sp. SO9]QQE79802.1 hypothetical protein GI364_04765 [Alicyclobacillus sp. SO9]
MWRLQVWEGKHNVEGFLLDSEEEVQAKKEEMKSKYPGPVYSIKIEELRRPNKKATKIKRVVDAIFDALS